MDKGGVKNNIFYTLSNLLDDEIYDETFTMLVLKYIQSMSVEDLQ